MFLKATIRRNPDLIETAIELHRSGRIPSNCYVVDVDTVAGNAAVLAEAADRMKLSCFQMTKQFGRNPIVAQAVARGGIPKVVAVDFEEARVLHEAGLDLGHMGHLVQVPKEHVSDALAMAPDLITVFGLPQAQRVGAAAAKMGIEQAVLIRVVGDHDFFYPAQHGGVPFDDLVETASAINEHPGVRFAGITSFPCILWNEDSKSLEPSKNLETLQHAAQELRSAGIETSVINAPSANCIASFGISAAAGASHVEPGSSLTGSTPLHALSDEPEIPAMVYVTEVTHELAGRSFTLGGGFYPRSRAKRALIDTTRGRVFAEVEPDPADVIAYYGALRPPEGSKVAVGNTAVYAFRSQVFVSHSYVVPIRVSSSEVLGVFDQSGNRIGSDRSNPAEDRA